jgi:Bacterial extracellular solute-binding proteins, family 3
MTRRVGLTGPARFERARTSPLATHRNRVSATFEGLERGAQPSPDRYGIARGASLRARRPEEERRGWVNLHVGAKAPAAGNRTGSRRCQTRRGSLLRLLCEELLTSVVDGRADIAAAALTVTTAWQQMVDFIPPPARGSTRIVVTGPRAPTVASLEDLAGREVFVRKSSAYSERLAAASAAPIHRQGCSPLANPASVSS